MGEPSRPRRGRPGVGIPSLVEEDVQDRVADAIHYAGWLMDHVDPTHRLSRVALGCRLDGVGYLPWRTRAKAAASPNSASMNLSGRESAKSAPVVLPRAALLLDGARQAEDITGAPSAAGETLADTAAVAGGEGPEGPEGPI